MTTKQTLQTLKRAGKAVSLGRLYVYLQQCGIKPSGANQRPQQYPPDTAERIKAHLGLGSMPQYIEGSIPQYTDSDALPRSKKILSLNQIKRATRRKTKGMK